MNPFSKESPATELQIVQAKFGNDANMIGAYITYYKAMEEYR